MEWKRQGVMCFGVLLCVLSRNVADQKLGEKKIRYATSSEAEDSLYKKLFKSYNKQIRPVINETDAVNVTFGMSLNQIIDVDEKNQMLTISVWIRQVWGNPLLRWDPAEFNGIKSINIDAATVWLPDIVLYNNADEDKSFGGNMDRMNTRIILDYTGLSKWLAPIILKSKCPINVQYFPFDEQKCELKFGSWTYDGYRLNLMAEADAADLGKYLRNSEWRLVKVPATRHQIVYVCCPEPYYDVTFDVVIRRRSLFYMTNLIFPMVVIGMLTIMAFILPAESGERVSLAITLLLSMTVFMLVVADIIPPTSEVVPLVGVFFSAAMVEMVIMILVLCYSLRLYHKGSSDAPMPWWMRKYLLEWLSYKLGVRNHEHAKKVNKSNGQPAYVQAPNGATTVHYTPKASSENAIWVQRAGVYPDAKRNAYPMESPHHSNGLEYNGNIPAARGNSSGCVTCRCQCDTIKHLAAITDRVNADIVESQQKEEWRLVAKTVDQCLLILFVVVVFLTTIICFSQSPGYVS